MYSFGLFPDHYGCFLGTRYSMVPSKSTKVASHVGSWPNDLGSFFLSAIRAQGRGT